MAEAIGEDCELIEFGSGSGLKTRLLLEQLRSPRAYLPVDISREHSSDRHATWPSVSRAFDVIPVHADFTAPLLLPETGDPRARRVVYFPGSTIGNFSPRAATEPALHDRLAGRRRRRALDRLRPRQGRIDRLARLQRSPGHERRVQPELARAHQSRARRRLRPFGVFATGPTTFARRNEWRCISSAGKPQVVRIAGMEFAFDAGRDDPYRIFLQILARALRPADVACRLHAWPAVDRIRSEYFAVQYLTWSDQSRSPLGTRNRSARSNAPWTARASTAAGIAPSIEDHRARRRGGCR